MDRSAAWSWATALAHCRREAARYARDPADADDIAQAATLRAWRAREAGLEPRLPLAWLSRITQREAYRLHGRRRPTEPLDERVGGPDDETSDVIERLAVRQAVGELPHLDQELLRLRYVDDLTQPGIADRLGLPEGTVKVRLSRARGRLRAMLSEHG